MHHTRDPSALTFSFLQAKAAALFCLCCDAPWPTKVMGQGQSRVRVDSLVLVPTVWNCMRFYTKGREGGCKTARNGSVLKCSLNAKEPRYGFYPHLSRYQRQPQRSANEQAEESPVGLQFQDLGMVSQEGDSIWGNALPALLAHCPLSTVKAHRCDGELWWKLPTQS